MSKNIFLLLFIPLMILSSSDLTAQGDYEYDIFDTEAGELELWFIGHGTLMLKLNDYVIHIDPVRREGDYTLLPKADLILITHSHGDHLDPKAIEMLQKEKTSLICNLVSAEKVEETMVMTNGDQCKWTFSEDDWIVVEAVPAYNIKHERSPGVPFHPKGEGNGYVLTLGGKRIYIAGDTENIPEMSDLKDIDIAFLPMNLPYTMSPEMATEAARMFNPAIIYPYHFGSSDTGKLVDLLKGSGIDVRIRKF